MDRVDKLDSVEVQRLRARLAPLLERVAADTGLVVSMGKISYTGNNAVFSIEAAVRGPGGVPMGREAEAFLEGAMRFGLEPTDLGRDFEHLDKWYRIVGLSPRKTKAPVVCQRISPPSSHQALFPSQLVRHYLEKHGMRAKTSPFARVRVEVLGEATETDVAAE